MLVSLKKWGNSASVRIPSLIVESLNLQVNSLLEIKEENGRIILKPVKVETFTLEGLLSEITEDNLHDRIDFGQPTGKELI